MRPFFQTATLVVLLTTSLAFKTLPSTHISSSFPTSKVLLTDENKCSAIINNRCSPPCNLKMIQMASLSSSSPSPNSYPSPFPLISNICISINKLVTQKVSYLCGIFITAIALVLSNPKIANAISTISNKANNAAVKGWDLFGRIPHDDWLFSTWSLTDKRLLQRSFVEAITEELPDVLINYKRRKRINEIVNVIGGFGYFALGMVCVTILYRGAIKSYRRRVEREDKMRGFSMPTSAISKKAPKKGRQLDNMDKGWIDMEATEGPENKKKNKNKNVDDDDDEDDEDEDE